MNRSSSSLTDVLFSVAFFNSKLFDSSELLYRCITGIHSMTALHCIRQTNKITILQYSSLMATSVNVCVCLCGRAHVYTFEIEKTTKNFNVKVSSLKHYSSIKYTSYNFYTSHITQK